MAIPKIIHYCWFGGNPLPDLAVRCIESWKKYFSDYEIREWNESNYNLDCCNYVKEAYGEGKWAFVSDYVRFDVLYQYGGVYFDTDVEVIKSFVDLMERGAFMGCEPMMPELTVASSGNRQAKYKMHLAPGLGLAANPGLGLYREILEDYRQVHYLNEDGTLDTTTVVIRTTEILKKYGFCPDSKEIQVVNGIYIYPDEYFCPMNYMTGKLTITDKTYSIHHYTASWQSSTEKRITAITWAFCGKGKLVYMIGSVVVLPFKITKKIQQHGFEGAVKFVFRKLKGS